MITAGGMIVAASISAVLYFMPMSWGMKHEAEHRVTTIFNLVQQAQQGGSAPWICDSIEKEWLALCADLPLHPLCKDREAIKDIRRRAGC